MRVTPDSDGIVVGLARGSVSPRPGCAYRFAPQTHTVPSDFSRQHVLRTARDLHDRIEARDAPRRELLRARLPGLREHASRQQTFAILPHIHTVPWSRSAAPPYSNAAITVTRSSAATGVGCGRT